MAANPVIAIRDAVLLLGFTDRASLNEIQHRYRELVKEWHPDVSEHDSERSHGMFIQLKEAYDMLVDYCMNHEISFRIEDLTKDAGHNSRDFWLRRFGEDPIWS
jgi:hypothetical protein